MDSSYGFDELMASFASDNFAVQSQPERDLRESLISFFAPGSAHNPNGRSQRADNNGCPTHRRIPNLGCPAPPGYRMTQEAELPPQNTPVGSPMREDGPFYWPVEQTNARSPAEALPNCLGCLHAISFPGATFPHHEACQHAYPNNQRTAPAHAQNVPAGQQIGQLEQIRT